LLLGMNLPLMVSIFTFVNLLGRRSAVAVGTAASAGVIAASLLPYAFEDDTIPFFWADVLNIAAYAVMPVVLVVIVAQVLREQRLRADAAQREAAMAMVSAELRAASAASAERRRLASELHDIVAHHVNLMVVQAEKGPFVRDPEGSSRTYATIAETGRAALAELDRLLGVLRTDGTGSIGGPQMAPLPTIDEIPSLVGAANRAGVSLVLRTFEPPPVVEPAVAATVHRIVQECITNVVKHADHAEVASLSVTHAGSNTTVRMENRSGGAQRGARRGHGLDSMRSRLEVFGGSLVADERDGMFRVEAIMPFTVPKRTSVDRSAVTA
jgi:signal transduction histidine kinase